jgi:hypothetical protein
MITKKNTSSAKKATSPKKPAAKTTKTAAASGKSRSKAKPKSGFLKTAGRSAGEVVQTIAGGAVEGGAIAAKGLLEKQIRSTSKTTSPAAKKAKGTNGKKTPSSTAKKSRTTKGSASKSGK